jgi:hypothetical protein
VAEVEVLYPIGEIFALAQSVHVAIKVTVPPDATGFGEADRVTTGTQPEVVQELSGPFMWIV